MISHAINLWQTRSLAGSAFSPSSLNGLWGWWDAGDAATLFQDSGFSTPAASNGDPVGGWQDKSGNSRHGTQSGAPRPTLVTGSLNGMPGVDFVFGSSQFLNLASAAALANVTFCAVLRTDDTTGIKSIFGGDTNSMTIAAESAEKLRLGKENSGSPVLIQTGSGLATAQYVTIGYESGADPSLSQYPLRVNGVSDKSFNASQSFTAATAFLGWSSGGKYYDGRLYEICAWNRILNSGEYAQVEAYLKAKWGL